MFLSLLSEGLKSKPVCISATDFRVNGLSRIDVQGLRKHYIPFRGPLYNPQLLHDPVPTFPPVLCGGRAFQLLFDLDKFSLDQGCIGSRLSGSYKLNLVECNFYPSAESFTTQQGRRKRQETHMVRLPLIYLYAISKSFSAKAYIRTIYYQLYHDFAGDSRNKIHPSETTQLPNIGP